MVGQAVAFPASGERGTWQYHRRTMAGPERRRLTLSRRRAGMATLAATAAAAALLAGCSGGSPKASTGNSGGTTGTTKPLTAAGLDWVVTRQALADIAASPSALGVLEQGHIYEIVRPGHKPYPGVNAIVTADFKSFSSPNGMAASVAAGDLPAGTGALLYDPESWSFTPPAEQHDLGHYVSMAVSLAHQHGWQLIVTPGVDLTKVLDPSVAASNGRYQAFLSSGLDQAVASADVVDVQAQSDERVSANYASFVKAAADQLHKANPKVVVISGLSSNPPIGVVTSQELADAMAVVAGFVQGYWMNIPNGPNPSCPGCGQPQPQVAIGALTTAFP